MFRGAPANFFVKSFLQIKGKKKPTEVGFCKCEFSRMMTAK